MASSLNVSDRVSLVSIIAGMSANTELSENKIEYVFVYASLLYAVRIFLTFVLTFVYNVV